MDADSETSARLVAENTARVKERIERAALACGRDPLSVKLAAVAKTVPARLVAAAVQAGVSIIAENYIQEAREKIEALAGLPVSWHFIGHLQTNKARYAARLFDWIHTVDSQRLAEELSRRLEIENRRMTVLIEVNVGGEASKSGVSPDDAPELAAKIAALPRLDLKGLMAMPPWAENPEDSRPYFVALRRLAEKIEGMKIENVSMTKLSMGLSHDFEEAIKEGATIIRVGTAIFGGRR